MINNDKHFCTCPMTKCPRHPFNHNEGCDPCIKNNLQHGKMPACMFKAVSENTDQVKEWTIKGFMEFYNNINKLK